MRLLPILFLAACSVAHGQGGSIDYHLKGGPPIVEGELGFPTCGRGPAMADDTYLLKYFGRDSLTINGVRWTLEYGSIPGDANIDRWTGPDLLDWEYLDLTSDDTKARGKLSIYAQLPDGKRCMDAVSVDGLRL